MTQTATRPIVGMIGKKRAGKDTFAGALERDFGFARIAFADPLREAALRLDPIIVQDGHDVTPVRLSTLVAGLGWEEAKDVFPEVRRTLQRLGSDVIRAVDPDFWVDAAVATIAATSGPVVVTDVRFPNEADAIRALGGQLVRVVRPPAPGEVRDEHASETALDGYPTDATVLNDATVDDLIAAARYLGADLT